MDTFITARLVFVTSFAVLLTACGGGGGGGSSGPVASTNAFNIGAGYQRFASAGMSKTFSINGTCSGTMTLTVGPANTSTTFEGSAALSATSVLSMALTNCNPPSSVSTETRYYDTNFVPKGYSVQGGNYGVATSVFLLPVSAHVGDAAVVGSQNIYTSSTKGTSAGRQDLSYVIEADTATTAIVNLISKMYNASNILTSTEQDRYRVSADGSLSLISLDIQYANGSTTHLIMN